MRIAVSGTHSVGKSTLVAALCGLIPARKGRIVYEGIDITELPAHERARRGRQEIVRSRQQWRRLTPAGNPNRLRE